MLEQFSLASLSNWKSAGKKLEALSHTLFFGLERHRAINAAALADAVRSQLSGPFRFEGWARVVDYRFTLDPLSLEGSIRRDGGRFNIGAAIDPAAYTPFPALYVAEDFETAFRERFGIERTHKRGGLSAEELVLRGLGSFTNVELRGMAELVLDVGKRDALAPAASVLATFQMPSEVRKAAPPQARMRSCIHLQGMAASTAWLCFPRIGGTAALSWKFRVLRLHLL